MNDVVNEKTMDKEKNRIIRINIVDVIGLLKNDKKKIALYCGIAAVFGVVIALTTPKTYDSTVMLAPEESGMGFSGNISSLASMVGMNMKMGQSGDAIYPEIYPDLVESINFSVGLFPVKVRTKDGKVQCDYYTYLTKHTKCGLLDYPKLALANIIKSVKSEDKMKPTFNGKDDKTPLWLTHEQDEVVKGILGSIKCSVDKKTSVITLTVTDQDPMVAAIMADSVKNHLQVAITEYRTKKACVDLEYMQKLYREARAQYDKARQLYASYSDANQDVILQTYQLKIDDLENDMQLKYNIYQQVVEQLQLAKAKVQERTPAFTVVQSATVPLRKSSKSNALVVLIWIFFGFVARTFVLMWKNKNLFVNI